MDINFKFNNKNVIDKFKKDTDRPYYSHFNDFLGNIKNTDDSKEQKRDDKPNFTFKGEIPNGVDLHQNAKLGESIRRNNDNAWYKNDMNTLLDFVNLVESGAKMDYKRLDTEALANKTPSKYEDFGNYNYGVVARSMGINRDLAIAAGGAYQATQIMQRAFKNIEKNEDPFKGLSQEDRKKYEPYLSIAKDKKKKADTKYFNEYFKNQPIKLLLFHYFINESMKKAKETGDYSYFDDFKDSNFIKQGYDDAQKNGYGSQFEPINFDSKLLKALNKAVELISKADNNSQQELAQAFNECEKVKL